MRRNILYYGLRRSEYDLCRPQIAAHTGRSNRILARLGFLGMALLFLVSLPVPQLDAFRKSYFLFGVLFLLLSVCTLKKQKQHAVLLLYLICFTYCAFGISLALPYPNEKPMIIHLIFLVLPLLFVDLPARVLAYTFTAAAAYILFVLQCLDARLRFAELYNTVVLFFIANIIHWLINKDRCAGFLAQIKRDEALRGLRKAQTELLRISETDPLTGLKNRRKLFETFASIQAGRTSPPDGAFMIDVDHFKALNDQYGHAAGDQVLRQLGAQLLELEKTEELSVYRYGGEEFAALAWNRDRQGLARLGEKIRSATAAIAAGPDAPVTVSIGFVDCDRAELLNYEKWLDLADAAVYEAKRQGRDRMICWNDMEPSPEE